VTDYISVPQLRDYIGSDTSNFEAVAASVCTVASYAIDSMCGRNFAAAGTVASARSIPADWLQNYYRHDVYDIATTTDLVIKTDTDGDGTFETTWTASDYQLEPLNGIVSGRSGYPFDTIRAVGDYLFPSLCHGQASLQVTARWGWVATPDEVEHAALVGAAELFKGKDAIDGYVGLDGWGPVRIRENPKVRALLGPYMKHPVSVG
jgi:hypothetical protein